MNQLLPRLTNRAWLRETVMVAVGVVLLYVASVMYVVSARRQIAESKAST
ncbi:MAG: hypothetical protein ACKOTH_10815 [Solirubrobacterales bacterium]